MSTAVRNQSSQLHDTVWNAHQNEVTVSGRAVIVCKSVPWLVDVIVSVVVATILASYRSEPESDSPRRMKGKLLGGGDSPPWVMWVMWLMWAMWAMWVVVFKIDLCWLVEDGTGHMDDQ